MNIKIVAYYTPNYLDEINGLKATASEQGLTVHALKVHEMTWAQAVMMKPQFILDRVEDLEDEYDGVLYTDADSRFRRLPDWSWFSKADFSCHFFRRSRVCEPEMLTGTMYFRRRPEVVTFLKDWAAMTDQFGHTDTPEQNSLKAVWAYWQDRLRFVDIGPGMVWIFDDFPALYPGVVPTLEHLQASRRYRR